MLVHNFFNINLKKFGQSNVKWGKCFFASSLEWSVISPNLKGGKCNYVLKKKLFDSAILSITH